MVGRHFGLHFGLHFGADRLRPASQQYFFLLAHDVSDVEHLATRSQRQPLRKDPSVWKGFSNPPLRLVAVLIDQQPRQGMLPSEHRWLLLTTESAYANAAVPHRLGTPD